VNSEGIHRGLSFINSEAHDTNSYSKAAILLFMVLHFSHHTIPEVRRVGKEDSFLQIMGGNEK